MKMRILLTFAVIASAMAFSGCTTAARQQAVETATRLGTPTELVSKMERGGRLNLTDLETLARHHVPDENVIAYLRQSGAAYELTTAQIDRMRAAGVSVSLIDYLLTTPRQVARRYRGYYGGGRRFYGYGHGFPSHGWGHGLIHHGGHH